jgi:phosphoserine phosphatase RsbX
MAVHAAQLLDYRTAGWALAGHEGSGDRHAVIHNSRGALLAVADGLGHGAEAALAAQRAMATLESDAELPLNRLFERCHTALRGTRGVVMSLARLDAADSSLTWLAVGNVIAARVRIAEHGRVVRDQAIMRGGIVGHQLPALRPDVLPLRERDLIILATDGIRAGFAEAVNPRASPGDIAEFLLPRYGLASDDALILVARWNGAAAADREAG